jgi:hypothetical protein
MCVVGVVDGLLLGWAWLCRGSALALRGRTPGAEETAEKVAARTKCRPQRLKPCCKCSTYGTGKPVPLSTTEAKPSFQQPVKPGLWMGVDAKAEALAYLEARANAGILAAPE